MCGICGYYSKNAPSRYQFIKMNDSMWHRGPDDAGVEVMKAGNGYSVGLGHRRLSIMDLSFAGHQPMSSTDGRISVVFNGEIYNYRELKNELIHNYTFHSNCDTEVVLAAYIRWGRKCVEHFNGMFAIALYDKNTEELILFRDRIGKKPLYYWHGIEDFCFASELKPIVLYPFFNKKINQDIIPRYLYKQYICSPDTIFKDVYKLEPGGYLVYSKGRLEKGEYWNLADVYADWSKRRIKNYKDAKTALDHVLYEAVCCRMISDVPLGAFLSGGYDSSLVTAMAQRKLGIKKLKTFSVGFEDKEFNEADAAYDIAKYIGTDHTEIYCTQDDMLDLIDDMPMFYDEPFADPSLIPSMLVSKIAKEDVTVVLSGDGGDELFCGYGIYKTLSVAEKFDGIGRLLHFVGNKTGMERLYPLPVRVVSENRDCRTKTQIGSQMYVDMVRKMALDSKASKVKYISELNYVKNWQIRRMLLDMDTYLPDDILEKVDRASMRYSLECRCPILDKNVIELSFRLEHKFKYSRGIGKRILKDIASDYVPRELLDRPKKGFGIPLDKWMRNELRDQLYTFSNEKYLKEQAIFNPAVTSKLIDFYIKNGDKGKGTGKNYSGICWSFFVFQKWYQKYFG